MFMMFTKKYIDVYGICMRLTVYDDNYICV